MYKSLYIISLFLLTGVAENSFAIVGLSAVQLRKLGNNWAINFQLITITHELEL